MTPGTWLYLGAYNVQAEKRLRLPETLDNNGIVSLCEESMGWCYSQQEHSHILITPSCDFPNHFEEEMGRKQYYKTAQNFVSIPSRMHSENQHNLDNKTLVSGETRHFIIKEGETDSGWVYVLSSNQLENKVEHNNWVKNSENKDKIQETIDDEDLHFPPNAAPPWASLKANKTSEKDSDGLVLRDPTFEEQTDSSVVSGSAELCPDGEAATSYIKSEMQNNPPSSVYFLEYSSKKADNLIWEALKSGANVFLLVRYPSTDALWSVSESQGNRIVETITERFADYRDAPWRKKNEWRLFTQFYYRRASLRARRLDNRLLCAGWYTFENRDTKNHGNNTLQSKRPWQKRVQGHSNPMTIYRSRSGLYERVNEMFRKSFYCLWKQGTTPLEVYHSDKEYFSDWLKNKSGRERVLDEASRESADSIGFTPEPWMNEVAPADDLHEIFRGNESP